MLLFFFGIFESTPVKLNPPTNLTVQMGSDSNLWFYWNQTHKCVESEVRIRINGKEWEVSEKKNLFLKCCKNNDVSCLGWQISHVSVERKFYTINLPSDSSLYELQVHSRLDKNCGQSLYWSEWSNPVTWGSNNGTGKRTKLAHLLNSADEHEHETLHSCIRAIEENNVVNYNCPNIEV